MGIDDDMTGMPPDLQKRVDAGMGCGSYLMDGWRELIIQLDEDIARLDPDYKVDQIKEKFGGLRYYITISNEGVSKEVSEEVYALINIAEDRSMELCDICGKVGTRATQSRGYIATRCDDHKI